MIAGLALRGVAYAYPDAIDGKINHYISSGMPLNQKWARLENEQQALLTQQKQLDTEGARLTKDQETYNNLVEQRNRRAAEHKAEIEEARKQCPNFGPRKNLEQLAQSADSAALSTGCTGFCNNGAVNLDVRQENEYAHKCNAKIKQINDKTFQEISGTSSLLSKQGNLRERSTEHSAKISAWNRREMEVISTLNDVYREINAWQNDAESFMQSDAFQEQIAWAHADKICTTPSFRGTSRERMAKTSHYIFTCLNNVENARKHFYAHYDEYLKKWYPGYYKALQKTPGGGGP